MELTHTYPVDACRMVCDANSLGLTLDRYLDLACTGQLNYDGTLRDRTTVWVSEGCAREMLADCQGLGLTFPEYICAAIAGSLFEFDDAGEITQEVKAVRERPPGQRPAGAYPDPFSRLDPDPDLDPDLT